jgi:hypothetical protein
VERLWYLLKERYAVFLRSFPGIWAYAVALLIGSIFVGAMLDHQPKGERLDPTRDGIILGVAFIGVQLLAIVIYDASKRYSAKQKLGSFLAELSPEEVERLRTIVSSTTFQAFFGYFPNDRVREQFSGWQGLLFFLNNEPLGWTASRALFQPSLAGRLRYLDSALWQGRRRRFAYRVV